MVSFETLCDRFAGEKPFPHETRFDLTNCTAMIGEDSESEYIIVYLPLDEDNNPEPEEISAEVKRVLSDAGYSASAELNGEAIIAR